MFTKLKTIFLGFSVFFLLFQTRLILQDYLVSGSRFEYGVYSLYFVDLFILGAIICFLIETFLKKKQVADFFLNPKILLTIILLDTLYFIAIFFAGDRGLAILKYGWLLISFLFLLSLASVRKIELIVVFIISAVLQAGLGIYQFIVQFVSANKYLGIASHSPADLGVPVIEFMGQRLLRSYGGFDHPNILGAVLAIAIIFVLILLMKDRVKHNLLLFSSLPILLLGLLSSFSRSAMLALLVFLLILGIFSIFKKYRIQLALSKYYWFGLIIFLVIIGIIFRAPLLSRADFNNRLEIISETERLAQAKQSLAMIVQHPFGVGLGNYGLELMKLNPQLPVFDYQPVHNVIFLIASEAGIIAVVIFLVLLLLFLLPKKPENPALLGALLVLLCFDHWLFSLHFGILFLGMVLAFSQFENVSAKTKNLSSSAPEF